MSEKDKYCAELEVKHGSKRTALLIRQLVESEAYKGLIERWLDDDIESYNMKMNQDDISPEERDRAFRMKREVERIRDYPHSLLREFKED